MRNRGCVDLIAKGMCDVNVLGWSVWYGRSMYGVVCGLPVQDW